MDTVKFDVKSAEEASRVELFVRFVWAIITYIVMGILSMVFSVCWIVQFLVILITGKRNAALGKWIKVYVNYVAQVYAYFGLLTDERNPIMPEM